MSYTISAVKRTALGRQAKGELAAQRIPAVMYGRGMDSDVVSVPRSDFLRVFKAAGYSALVDVSVEGAGSVKTLVKEVQVDPLSMEPVHVDFLKVRMDQELTAEIPLVFIGSSKAVELEGGTLVKSLDQLEIRCLPGDLPHEIQVDLGKLNTFDDAITVGDLALPKGVKAVTDAGVTVATVARPLTEEELKKLEESAIGDVTAIKTEAEEKKAADEAAAAAEGTAVEGEAKGKAEAKGK